MKINIGYLKKHINDEIKHISIGKIPNGEAHLCIHYSTTYYLNPYCMEFLQIHKLAKCHTCHDINSMSTYITLKFNGIFSNLFDIVLHRNTNNWMEENHARDPFHTSFRPKHSTIYHLSTLQVIAQKLRWKGIIFNLHCQLCLIQCLK